MSRVELELSIAKAQLNSIELSSWLGSIINESDFKV